MAFQTITQIGLDKAVAASAGGFAVKITHIGAGTSGYNPLRSRQALSNEVVRVPLAGGRDVSANQVHLTGIFDTGEFACRELGFYLEDGTLFSVVSHPTNTIFYKTALNKVVQAFDLSLDAVPMDSVTVDTTGDLNLFYASEMSQLATASISGMLRDIRFSEQARFLERDALQAQDDISALQRANQGFRDEISGIIAGDAFSQKMLGGLIIKGGFGQAAVEPATLTATPMGGTNIFPKAFPNACIGGIGIHFGSQATSTNIILSSLKPPSAADITFISAWSSPVSIFYIAFGY